MLGNLREVTECRTKVSDAVVVTYYSVRELRCRGATDTRVPNTYTMAGSWRISIDGEKDLPRSETARSKVG